jgi:16S rRNA (cytosine1402-N4)-methyltransferase
VEQARVPTFALTPKKAIAPDEDEIAENPRARSSRLRVATRTEAPAAPVDRTKLGLPLMPEVL